MITFLISFTTSFIITFTCCSILLYFLNNKKDK